MTNLKRYTFQIAGMSILSLLALAGARTTVSEIKAKHVPSELPSLNLAAQQGHALELAQRGIASVKDNQDLRRDIYVAVKSQLPKKYRTRAFEISRAVINEANHHGMDPFFLMAVIKTESHFNIKARGRHGEIGLMQIMPKTAKWIAAQAGLNTQHLNLEDPATNIRIGATYFASLRKEFNGVSAQYIGAYNMGSANVRRLAAENIEPTVYPGKVLNNYRGFYVSMAKSAPVVNSIVRKEKAIRKLETRVVPAFKVPRAAIQTLMPQWETT